MKTCIEIVRALREDNNLKQSEIAAVLGITQQQYSNYEIGVSELPVRVLDQLCKYYGVSADYILGHTGCREGADALGGMVSNTYSVGALVSDVLSLDDASRAAVAEYVSLRKIKQAWDALQAKRRKTQTRDGSRSIP